MSRSAVSLFTNCGAGDVGFAKAGYQFDILAEIDARRLAVAGLNLPGSSLILGDLRRTWRKVVSTYHDRRGTGAAGALGRVPSLSGSLDCKRHQRDGGGCGRWLERLTEPARRADRRSRDRPITAGYRCGERSGLPDPEGPTPSHAGGRVGSGAPSLTVGGQSTLPSLS